MKVFELMSRGNIVRLPDDMQIAGLPAGEAPLVVLLLPYNRVIVGTSVCYSCEKWFWGKLGSDEWSEIFLYDGHPRRLVVGRGVEIVLSAHVATQLRGYLLSQLPPPGNHLSTVLIMKGFLGDFPIFQSAMEWNNESEFLDYLRGEEYVRLVYWGIRRALLIGDHSMIGRIKMWSRSAPHAFEGEGPLPSMWFSVGDLPGSDAMLELERLFFGQEQLQKMNMKTNTSVVLRGSSGYLVKFEQQRPFGGNVVTVWMYFPTYIWELLKERRELSVQEIVLSAWGCLEAQEAAGEMERYGGLRQTANLHN